MGYAMMEGAKNEWREIMPKAGKSYLKPIIADSGTRLSLIDPDATCGFSGDKAETAAVTAELTARLVQLQEELHAEHKHKVLVVFQAMDTGGKDGATRKVFSGLNPQGVRVTSFKAPTAAELDRDYLWRVHQHVPAKGEIAIFNRSHYEDVLITRVHGWIDAKQCERRYRHILEFERMLAHEGTTILKFFLHISKDEQKRRLQERLDDPAKHWKFNPGDLDERKLWDEYQGAYQRALRETSRDHAPWYVVPANRKWLRDLYVSQELVKALTGLKMKYPKPAPGLDKIRIK
jgi:PPK2 family polyphosphate:nucleotide phosphotransferase